MSQTPLFDVPRRVPPLPAMVPARLPESAEGLLQLRAVALTLLDRGLTLDRILGRRTDLVDWSLAELALGLILGRVPVGSVDEHLGMLRDMERGFSEGREKVLAAEQHLSRLLAAEQSASPVARDLLLGNFLDYSGPYPAHVALRCTMPAGSITLLLSTQLGILDLVDTLIEAFGLPDEHWEVLHRGRPLCDLETPFPLALMPKGTTLLCAGHAVAVDVLGCPGAEDHVAVRVILAQGRVNAEGLDVDFDAPVRALFKPLTPRQRDCMNAIADWMESNGEAPSNTELAAELGVSSASVSTMLGRLEKDGWITRQKGVSRSVRIVRQPASGPFAAFLGW